MDSHEIVRACFAYKSPKEIAAEIGISSSLLYKWAEPTGDFGSGSPNPLDRAAQLNDACPDHAVIKWLCHRCGGFFLENPEAGRKRYELSPATNELIQQFATLISEVAEAGIDERITDDEAASIRQRWETLKGFCEGFVSACERGDFDALRGSATSQL
ncbi:MAG: phage regulatory CII family protein [Opitutales bacterium]